MIQDIWPYNYRVEYRSCLPEDEDCVILMYEGRILVRLREENGREVIEYPRWKELKVYKDTVAEYLFTIEREGREHARFFFVWKGQAQSAVDDLLNRSFELVTQRNIQYYGPQWKAFAGTTACQIAGWYAKNQYCGVCGAVMEHSDIERMVYCPNCKIPVYPRINPVVIVGVTDGDKLLLTKYARNAYKRYALVAGFAEVGERIEDTVRREVYEETGIRVKNISFYKSQPWSLSDSLLFGFFCELDGSSEVSLNDGELAAAEWVRREDIPSYEDTVSLTTEMILHFKYDMV